MDDDLRALELKARAGDGAAAWALVRALERLGSQGATQRWLGLARLARAGDGEARRAMEMQPHSHGTHESTWYVRGRRIQKAPRIQSHQLDGGLHVVACTDRRMVLLDK